MHAHKKKQMGLLFVITLLSILFSSLLSPCASLPIRLQPALQRQGGVNNTHQKFSLPIVPRKLRFTEVKEYGEARDLASQKQKDSPAGKQYQRKQKMVLGSRGTRHEWIEEDDPSQYFTMDYTRVRRRRPIHNKQLPVGP